MTLQELILLEAVVFFVVSGALSLGRCQLLSKSAFLFGAINLLLAFALALVDWTGYA